MLQKDDLGVPFIVAKTFLMVGLQNFSFLFANSSRSSKNSNSKPYNERTNRLLKSILMDQCYLGIWDSLTHLSFLHDGRQILRHILEKCLKAFNVAAVSPTHKITF